MPTLRAPSSRMLTSDLCWFPSIQLLSSTTIITLHRFCSYLCRSWFYTLSGRGLDPLLSDGVCVCVNLFRWFVGTRLVFYDRSKDASITRSLLDVSALQDTFIPCKHFWMSGLSFSCSFEEKLFIRNHGEKSRAVLPPGGHNLNSSSFSI